MDTDWVLHNLISLKEKKKRGRKKMKIYILSAINGNYWSIIILEYFFTCHFDALSIT